MDIIDTKSRLIQEVKIRPVLWDDVVRKKTSNVSKNVAWNDLVKSIFPKHEQMNEEERRGAKRKLQQIWNSLRDVWHRKYKEQKKNERTGKQSKASAPRRDMEFLRPIYDRKTKEESFKGIQLRVVPATVNVTTMTSPRPTPIASVSSSITDMKVDCDADTLVNYNLGKNNQCDNSNESCDIETGDAERNRPEEQYMQSAIHEQPEPPCTTVTASTSGMASFSVKKEPLIGESSTFIKAPDEFKAPKDDQGVRQRKLQKDYVPVSTEVLEIVDLVDDTDPVSSVSQSTNTISSIEEKEKTEKEEMWATYFNTCLRPYLINFKTQQQELSFKVQSMQLMQAILKEGNSCQ